MVTHLVIVAGGRGTRLASVAGDVPKILVPVAGKPVLQHQLELAASAGIRDVTICAGYLADAIVRFVGDGSSFGVTARVLIEAQPLGSAGAVLRSLDALPEHFLVVYGDVMLAVDLQRMASHHIERDADFTVLAHPNDHPHDSDLLEVDAAGLVTALHPYPHPRDQFFGNLVNAALYVVRRDALRPWAADGVTRDFVRDVLAGLVENRGRVVAYRSTEYIKDMGTPARLKRVDADWQGGVISVAQSTRCRPAVFLDRDGTLNVDKGHLRTPHELELLPGAAAALRSLREAGFRLIVLTNQPVVARGDATEADVDAIHRRLEWELGTEGAYLDGIYVCPHHPDGGFPGERKELKTVCECRKPATGLLERACRDLAVDAAGSWMIGDQTRDIEMARRAGLRSVLVRTGVAGRDARFAAEADFVADDLAAAARTILQDVSMSSS